MNRRLRRFLIRAHRFLRLARFWVELPVLPVILFGWGLQGLWTFMMNTEWTIPGDIITFPDLPIRNMLGM